MPRLTGYAVLTSPQCVEEFDTFTCIHCQNIRHVKPFQKDFTRCSFCDDLICEQCVGKPCDHFERKLQRQERQSY